MANKSFLTKIFDDVAMDLNLKEKDADYLSRVDERTQRSYDSVFPRSSIITSNNGSSSSEAQSSTPSTQSTSSNTDTSGARPELMTFDVNDIVGQGGARFGGDARSYIVLSDGKRFETNREIGVTQEMIDAGLKDHDHYAVSGIAPSARAKGTGGEIARVFNMAKTYVDAKNEQILKDQEAWDAANTNNEGDEDGDDLDEGPQLVADLDLEAVDDTAASREATETTNEAYEDVVDQSSDTFGTGAGVEDVIQENSSFIDPDEEARQLELATANAALDEALTFQGIRYPDATAYQRAVQEDASYWRSFYDQQARENAASAGGASSALGQVGSNQTTINSGDALSNVSEGAQYSTSSTAKGGEMEKDAAELTSTGASEDDAIEMYTKGRRSTILTTPGGLLNADEEYDDGTFRARRGLIS
tara:strand:+ start:38 stop:1291 length:1254 start_codon:yes stop_codon:yes gene_type:complete